MKELRKYLTVPTERADAGGPLWGVARRISKDGAVVMLNITPSHDYETVRKEVERMNLLHELRFSRRSNPR